MDLTLNETTVQALIMLLTEKVAELECDKFNLRDDLIRAENAVELAEGRVRDLHRDLDNVGRSAGDMNDLRDENERLRQQIRDQGNQLLNCNEDAKAIKFRYLMGDLRGKKIAAIKEVKDLTKCDLRSAKDYIEADGNY